MLVFHLLSHQVKRVPVPNLIMSVCLSVYHLSTYFCGAARILVANSFSALVCFILFDTGLLLCRPGQP